MTQAYYTYLKCYMRANNITCQASLFGVGCGIPQPGGVTWRGVPA